MSTNPTEIGFKSCLNPKKNDAAMWIYGLMALILGAGFIGGFLAAGGFSTVFPSGFNPRIDGKINPNEWNAAEFKMSKYLNTNTSLDHTTNTSDANGFNYLYVGTTGNKVVIANDLCSDRTNTTDGQWYGVFLNTMKRNFGANVTENDTNFDDWAMVNQMFPNSYYDMRNNGTESLIINMTTGQIMPMYWQTGSGYTTGHVFENGTKSDVNVTYGHPYPTQDDWTDTYTKNGNPFQYTLESNDWGDSGNVYERISLNITIHLDKYFIGYPKGYEQEFYSKISNFKVNMNTFLQLSNSHYFDPLTDNFDYAKVSVENNGTAPVDLEKGDRVDSTFYIAPSAYVNGTINMYLNIYNRTTAAPLTWYGIDYMEWECNYPNHYDSAYGSSTLLNYTYASTFGTSPNSNVPHRMIEISFPIADLEGYNKTEGVSIFINSNAVGLGFNDVYSGGLMHQFFGATMWYGSNERRAKVFFFGAYIDFFTPSMADWSLNYLPIIFNH